MNDTESVADDVRAQREQLSALMDGDLDAAAACCRLWRERADARSNWHLYHLIGDVLRSDELACDVRRDAQLLRSVRCRLAAEPAAVGESSAAAAGAGRGSPVAAPAPRRWGRLAGAALAAVFMAAAGLTAVMQGLPASPRGADTSTPMPTPLAAGVVAPTPPVVAQSAVRSAELPAAAEDFQLVRDAQLDLYLAAHKQFGGSSALGLPSGFLRSATLQAPVR